MRHKSNAGKGKVNSLFLLVGEGIRSRSGGIRSKSVSGQVN